MAGACDRHGQLSIENSAHCGAAFGCRENVGYIPDFSGNDAGVIVAEHNAREGFFETQDFQRVLKEVSAYLKRILQAAYITGWRIGELRKIRTEVHVDMTHNFLVLDESLTKNKKPRVFEMTPDLRVIIEEQIRNNREFQMKTGRRFPWLFHYRGDQIGKDTYKNGWKAACKRAGLAGRHVHDFRRTAVRNLEMAGVERSASKQITGHLTDARFRALRDC